MLSSEEHGPQELVRFAGQAEQSGFEFVMISDHFHPWVDRQGQSPFVWPVLGAIAQATRKLRVGTGVTCPLIRIHPAIVAQASATAATMMPGRFFLGLGAGENLNEHIVGRKWPEPAVRLEMLEEAIGVIRLLWGGGTQSHRGRYYTVEQARLYTRPDEAPDIVVAATGQKVAELAARCADGLVTTSPDPELAARFRSAGGAKKPWYGQLNVCWAETEQEARRIAHEWWPTSAFGGDLSWEIATPELFGQMVEIVREDDVAESIFCGPDPEPTLSAIRSYQDAGVDHVFIHQVGPDQEGFFRFAQRDLLPRLN